MVHSHFESQPNTCWLLAHLLEPLVTVYPSIRQQSSLHHLHELSISTVPLGSDVKYLAPKKTCRFGR